MANDNVEQITEALKRMKQLENQNLKLRQLIDSAEDMSSQDADGIIQLKEEAKNLAKTVNDLEQEKVDLQRQLDEVFTEEIPVKNTLQQLEQEQENLQTTLQNVLGKIEKDKEEIESLKSEDEVLKQALMELQKEQETLQEQIRKLGSEDSQLSQHIANQRDTALSLEDPKPSLTKTIATKPLNNFNSAENSEENVISSFKNLEKTYRDYIEVLEDHSLQQKISTLETRNEELINDQDNTSEAESQIKLNTTIIKSNTDILHKIKEAKSKMVTSIETKATLIKSAEESKQVDIKLSELEREKDLLYAELEESLEHSTKEISKLREQITDAEIRRLVNEIEVQKAVLLYNLKTLKMKNEKEQPSSDEILKLPDVPKIEIDSKDVLPISLSQTSQVRPVPASTALFSLSSEWTPESSEHEASTSANPALNEHQRLEETVTRLENERKELLKQLHSISETSAQRFEERQLQTQSKNYDDATNQLYADEDARLEQRIRELEIENSRIKKELEVLTEQIRSEQNGAFQYTTKTLKDRINELESRSREK